MRICFFSKNYTNTSSAGNKAKTDMEQIMVDSGFVNVGLPQTIYSNKILSFIITFAGIIKAIFSIRKGDLLLLQYPLKKYYTFLCKITHLRGGKIVTLVHDLGSFRRKKLNISQEKKRLSNTDYIIALNPVMKNWLIDNGHTQPIGVLELWDYLSDSLPHKKEYSTENINIMHAGSTSLEQHSYIYKLDKQLQNDATLHFDMYGKDFYINNIQHTQSFTNKGFTSPDDIIKFHQSDYGLIWYGNSINYIDGNYGEYMQITTPHKPSLYIRCHIPVIVWEKMAIASFVKKNNIGILIKNLEDIDSVLASVTKEEYQIMKENVVKLSAQIAKGYFFNQAFDKAKEHFK